MHFGRVYRCFALKLKENILCGHKCPVHPNSYGCVQKDVLLTFLGLSIHCCGIVNALVKSQYCTPYHQLTLLGGNINITV
jgi:hypothetical protein